MWLVASGCALAGHGRGEQRKMRGKEEEEASGEKEKRIGRGRRSRLSSLFSRAATTSKPAKCRFRCRVG